MIEPLDRSRRDSTLFQFTTKQLPDFIDPNHLLIRIDEQLDFAKLVAPLEDCYCPDFGRPAIHPEVMVRALLICSLYNISSFRRLCSAISENIAYRWFCFLTIDDPVFDHSSISHFIDRIGRDGFAAIFDGLNDELLWLGMLSPEIYVDSSLVKANVSSHGLSPSGMSVAEFKERAIEVNGLFMIEENTVDHDGVQREEVRYFQDPKGRLPLSPVDTDARWRTSRVGNPSALSYQENVIVDRGGFIVSRGITHASTGEWKAVQDLLDGLPLQPVSLAADTAYNVGELREHLEGRGIVEYIPMHPKQAASMVANGDFVYHGDHLICPQGKILRRGSLHPRHHTYEYVARQKECQACPFKRTCLPEGHKRRRLGLTMYYPLYLKIQERNRSSSYHREQFHRKTIAEGTFASLDRLGWEKSRLRRLWKVDSEGYMAALAHNVLKMARRLGRGVGPPSLVAPADAIAQDVRRNVAEAAAFFTALSSCSGWIIWLTLRLRPALR
ncbi:MAG: transposase [Chloroflexi bacterium]|nr:transposase [Chloroflexota bacterium]MYD49212.1 transposase [Chloroflexota bacterium]